MHLIPRVYATSVKAKGLFNYYFFFSLQDAVSLYTKAGLELNYVTQAWYQTLSDPAASASRVLG